MPERDQRMILKMTKKSKDDKKVANQNISIPTTQILNIEGEKEKGEEGNEEELEKKSGGNGETKSVSINFGNNDSESNDQTSSTSKKIIL
jgi:hypothetical protein